MLDGSPMTTVGDDGVGLAPQLYPAEMPDGGFSEHPSVQE